MNWWEILEISKDSDLKTIKRAYAKLLKIFNPEDDAEGYQRLREAYDKGIKYARGRNENKTESPSEIVENNNYFNKKIKSSVDLYIDNNMIKNQDTSTDLHERIEEFLNRLKEIYNDIALRRNSKEWEELLNMDVVWDAYSFQIIEDRVFEFLIDNKYLPADIWLILKNNFNWGKNEIKLYNMYPTNKVNEFFKNFRNPNTLKYDYLDGLNSEIVDEYLSTRQKACEELENRNYSSAQKYLLLAYDIFKEDPELLRLIGNFYYTNGHLDKALEFAKAAFNINNLDLDSAFLIGKILEEKGNFNEALPYLKWDLSFNKDDKSALNYIGYCYYYTGELLLAKESFERLLSLQYYNKSIEKYLKNIELRLKNKSNKIIKFKEYKPKKQKVVQNEWKRQEAKKIKKSLIYAFIIFLICIFPIVRMFIYVLIMKLFR